MASKADQFSSPRSPWPHGLSFTLYLYKPLLFHNPFNFGGPRCHSSDGGATNVNGGPELNNTKARKNVFIFHSFQTEESAGKTARRRLEFWRKFREIVSILGLFKNFKKLRYNQWRFLKVMATLFYLHLNVCNIRRWILGEAAFLT